MKLKEIKKILGNELAQYTNDVLDGNITIEEFESNKDSYVEIVFLEIVRKSEYKNLKFQGSAVVKEIIVDLIEEEIESLKRGN